ncbi:MAG TPA: GAF and ANTAR domain-containing protein [Nocardioidaceae bacterium]|nr:GAF and ANTAR domain-containing protein [Nocardioidaceae bacterium]
MATARVRQILSQVLDQHRDGTTLPGVLCELCARQLLVTGVGLALFTDAGHEGVVAATDQTAMTLEELQFTSGEGPCVDASRGGRPVLQPDLATTAPRRWPGFASGAAEAGIAAVFAFPLQVGWVRVGVLDLYRDTTGSLDGEDLTEALAFADAALALLLDLQELTPSAQDMHPNLADPVGRRPEIHQATGMIAVQAAVGLAEALVLLRARAFGSGRTVAEIAREVVNRTLRFDNGDEQT